MDPADIATALSLPVLRTQSTSIPCAFFRNISFAIIIVICFIYVVDYRSQSYINETRKMSSFSLSVTIRMTRVQESGATFL
jgi:hypothetical protein